MVVFAGCDTPKSTNVDFLSSRALLGSFLPSATSLEQYTWLFAHRYIRVTCTHDFEAESQFFIPSDPPKTSVDCTISVKLPMSLNVGV